MISSDHTPVGIFHIPPDTYQTVCHLREKTLSASWAQKAPNRKADWLRSRTEYDHIPILLMSADVPREASSNKHLRTLQKPFELETLLQSVAELLA